MSDFARQVTQKVAQKMADSVRGLWQSVVNTKRAYLNPHEHFGRANITRAVVATYIGIFLAIKWNGSRKAKRIEQQKLAEKKNVLNDALARAGITS
jgi:flagellar motor switch protein FliM